MIPEGQQDRSAKGCKEGSATGIRLALGLQRRKGKERKAMATQVTRKMDRASGFGDARRPTSVLINRHWMEDQGWKFKRWWSRWGDVEILLLLLSRVSRRLITLGRDCLRIHSATDQTSKIRSPAEFTNSREDKTGMLRYICTLFHRRRLNVDKSSRRGQ